MKCGFCGNELENGAQFCPNCGMIISIGDENDAAQENDAVVENVYNVFKGNIEKEKKETVQNETAKELEVDPTEEKVEFVMSLPEFEDYIAEPIKAPEHIELPDHSVKSEEPVTETDAEVAEEPVEEPEVIAEVPSEQVNDKADDENADKDAGEDIYSYSSEDINEQEEAEKATESLDIRVPEMNVVYAGPKNAPELIKVNKSAPKNEELRQKKQAKANLEKISPDKKENKKKPAKGKKKGIDGIKIEGVLGIAVAIVLVLFACVYAVKNNKIPVLGELFGDNKKPVFVTDNGDEIYLDEEGNYYFCDDDGVTYIYVDPDLQQSTSEEDPTDENTTEAEWTESRPEEFIGDNGKKIYKDDEGNYYYYENDGTVMPYIAPVEDDSTEITTEESTTETTAESTTESTTKEITTETTTEVTTKPTTTESTTTKPTTTKPAATTTKPTTTKPAATTTKPTTTKPAASTTKPATTKPASTTKPNVTEGFGINDVEVKKPVSYLSKSYTAYVTVEGLTLRSKPTTESYKVLSLSKGADVVVLPKENGFLYIKSNRYGVYGWVSANYVANERPQSDSVVQSGTVTPDKKYATAEIKYTTNGLNVRKGPSTSYDIVGLVPISYPVKVIGYKSGVSGWVYVQDTTYGYTGWVSTAYIK